MSDVSLLILYNSKKQVLLQHRSAYKERWANHWGTFGGSIEGDETVRQALEREILEELGYQIQEPVLLYVQTLTTDKKYVYVELYDSSQELTPNKEECQDAQWVTIEEALALKLIPHEVETIEKMREFLNK